MSKKTLLVLMLILALSLSLLGACASRMNSNTPETEGSNGEIDSINEGNEATEGKGVINIALFGIDTGREKYEAAHADAIMILSIDKENKSLKLSSLMRDLYVDVEGYRKTRLNTAYTVGGPQLMIDTINKSFDLDVEDYITVDFKGLSSIIDALGGIELEIEDKEIKEINKYMKEVAQIKKEEPTPLTEPGLQQLNGNQAVAFARIRKVGDGDFERAERQNLVMKAVFARLQEMDAIKYPVIAAKLYPHVKTSLGVTDILAMSTEVLRMGVKSLQWSRFPLDGYWENAIINDAWYLETDLDITGKHIREFIYEESSQI